MKRLFREYLLKSITKVSIISPVGDKPIRIGISHNDDIKALSFACCLNLDASFVFTIVCTFTQGQQKSFALALKLAQFQYMNDRLGVKPILLLDDIFDKLDLLRVKQLVALVGSDRFGQVLLTDTQPGLHTARPH